ncbi:MAG: hypothetical protein WAR79_13245 [Melioribacteraceae bacterium]
MQDQIKFILQNLLFTFHSLLFTFHACLPLGMFLLFTLHSLLLTSCQFKDQKPQVIFDTLEIVKIDSFKVIEYDTLLTYLVDTVNTLVDIDSTAWFYFTQNFHDSMIYKTYAIVYSDTIFRNKRSPFERQKTKFIKWKNIIFETYQ